jgi:UDP-3-O-acyl-N-acetylglucosamine deacetylase
MRRRPGEVVRDGYGLHTGLVSRMVLRPDVGPISFLDGATRSPLSSARVVGTARATTLEMMGGRRVESVEHLLSAFGGLGVRRDVSIEVMGNELPLLGGGALAYAEALVELGSIRGEPPELEVVSDETVFAGDSSYSFRRADGVHLEVTLDFPDERIERTASWDGDPQDFLHRVAPARTFAFDAELAQLAQAGKTAHVSPDSVLVFTHDAVLSSGRPFTRDEPARHKLLDLVGDLFVYGGPPRGAICAHRPGHGATHAALDEALARGIVRRTRVVSSRRDAELSS